jgi:hypothetical protein
MNVAYDENFSILRTSVGFTGNIIEHNMRDSHFSTKFVQNNFCSHKYLPRPRRRLVDNIEMDLREIGLDGMDWIDLAQDRDQ